MEGWYHTGDIGAFDADGFVYITDRKKELIVTAAGKNISPANLENLMKGSRYISNIMVYGDKHKYIVALVCPEMNEVRSYLKEKGVAADDAARPGDIPEVRHLMNAEIELLNRELARFEQVKKFEILDEDFTVENDLATPTLKLKRKNIVKRYEDVITRLYADDVIL
jgi:long-chain acyl-CoA synthetase